MSKTNNTLSPQHVAFIMDGNRRWAKAKGLPTLLGHRKGFDRIEEIIHYGQEQGIRYLTFWAFSTENWKRDKKEVTYLMNLFRTMFQANWVKDSEKDGVQIRVIGDVTPFPKDIQKSIHDITERTRRNDRTTVIIGLNYGGREEILHAVNSLVKKKTKEVNEEDFAKALYTDGIPDPDFIIRSGGEQRLSGFLPWQSTYAELYFPDIHWPDFTQKEFAKALEEYTSRQRRFGK